MDEIKQSINLNDLVYLPVSSGASSVLNRVQRKFYPEKTSYVSSERIVIEITGNQFIDMRNCAVKFSFNPIGAAANFASGAFTNIFNRVRVISPTGKVISDLTNANLINKLNFRLKHSRLYVVQNSKTIGINDGSATSVSNNDGFRDIVIPMMDISPFFDNEQYLPPVISENMIIEFYLEDFRKVCANAGGLSQYSITNPQLIVDCVLMRDFMWKTINDMSSEYLVYEYEDQICEESFMSEGSNRGNIQCTRPISNALELVVSLRDSAGVNSAVADSFGTIPIRVSESQSKNDTVIFRIGDIQLPQQEAVGGAEIWSMVQHSLQQLNKKDRSSCSLIAHDFETTGIDNGGNACYVMNLRMSKLFNNSGREISNNQSAVATIQYHNQEGDNPTEHINGILNMFVRFISRIVIKNNILDVEN